MAFTNDWDETTPTDNTQANEIDDFNRKVRLDTRERMAVDHNLASSDTGQSVGEGTLGMHKKVELLNSTSVSAGVADHGILHAEDVSSKAELHYMDEDDNDVQITTAGDIGGTNVSLLAGKDLLGSATSDITMNTNKFTVAGATGNTVVAGTLSVTGVATLGDGSLLAAATEAGDGDRAIADLASVQSGGFPDVNGTPTAVFTKYLTGNLDADATTSVAHGVTAANILSVSAIAYSDGLSAYLVTDMFKGSSPNEDYYVDYDTTNVNFRTVGTNIQGNAYRIKIEYTA